MPSNPPQRRWTQAEDNRIRKLIATGVSASELVASLPGRTPGSVHHRMRKLGITGLAPDARAIWRQRAYEIPVTVTEKFCPKCGATKPAIDFQRRARATDGLDAECRECKAIRRK